MPTFSRRPTPLSVQAIMPICFVTTAVVLSIAVLGGCGGSAASPTRPGADGAAPSGTTPASPVIVSAAQPAQRTTTLAVNYWQWMPSYGDDITGTDGLVAALEPALMRVGGYNNDANLPDAFDDGAFDQAVAYARAIGAEPIVQVPLLADVNGQPPTPATAAGMVSYANVTNAYAIKYFSVGNEPDLYDAQGGLADASQPAIPGYTPTQYCTSMRAFVTAMKAVDPTIQIVGPDLSYKYQAGNSSADWLTPILTTCGDLFDVISIHRYPFEAAQANLAAAAKDPASFRNVIHSVQGILQATGQAAKPLALTEMNVVYDATTCALGASPGTVGSALWLADSVGTAIDLGLWTTAVWDISDTDGWSLGLIGMPPAHTPRPSYYAYALYADHFGPTLLQVTSAPSGVSAHASRNQAGDSTQIIAINWNASVAALTFQVTGLATTPAPATFVLPPQSMAAVEIPDLGSSSAWVYGESQRLAASAPQPLLAGTDLAPTVTSAGGGAGLAVGAGCRSDGGAPACPAVPAPGPTITTQGRAVGSALLFGSGADEWGSYTYAAPGQSPPVASVNADGSGVQIQATFAGPIQASANYMGVGLYFNSYSCLDVSAYTGVRFDFAGDLGGCTLAVGAVSSEQITPSEDANRGTCAGTDSNCYGASVVVTPTPTLSVPFADLSGGVPLSTVDTKELVDVQWQLTGPVGHDAGGCSASFTVSNVTLY